MAAHPKCELKVRERFRRRMRAYTRLRAESACACGRVLTYVSFGQVPAGCSARPGAGVVRGKSKRMSTTGPPAASAPSGANSLSRTASSLSGRSSLDSPGGSISGPPRRSVPPAFGSKPSSIASPPPRAASPPSPAYSAQTATLLYNFAASSEAELSVSAGEVVEVLAPEDEGGWIKARSPRDGSEGLVPASYVQMGGALPGVNRSSGGKEKSSMQQGAFAVHGRSASSGLHISPLGAANRFT